MQNQNAGLLEKKKKPQNTFIELNSKFKNDELWGQLVVAHWVELPAADASITYKPWFIHFLSRSLLMHQWRQQIMAQVLGPVPFTWEILMKSLTSAWPSGHRGLLRSESEDGRDRSLPLYSLPLCLQLCLSNKWINHCSKRKKRI